jgi:hypothetical protein
VPAIKEQQRVWTKNIPEFKSVFPLSKYESNETVKSWMDTGPASFIFGTVPAQYRVVTGWIQNRVHPMRPNYRAIMIYVHKIMKDVKDRLLYCLSTIFPNNLKQGHLQRKKLVLLY